MAYGIYCRIFGYVVTIVLHVSNIFYLLYTTSQLDGAILNEPDIHFFNAMQYRYFTTWTFILQIVYAVLGLWCDYLTLKNSSKGYRLPKYLKGARNTLFSGIQWPSSWLVCTFFWTFYIYDRNLILPSFTDKILTKTANHIMHTAIVPIVVWELIFQPRTVPKSHIRNLVHLLCHILFYYFVLVYTYYEHGKWIYPIFGLLHGSIYFHLLIILVGVLLLFYYCLQWYLTRLIWGSLEKTKVNTD